MRGKAGAVSGSRSCPCFARLRAHYFLAFLALSSLACASWALRKDVIGGGGGWLDMRCPEVRWLWPWFALTAVWGVRAGWVFYFLEMRRPTAAFYEYEGVAFRVVAGLVTIGLIEGEEPLWAGSERAAMRGRGEVFALAYTLALRTGVIPVGEEIGACPLLYCFVALGVALLVEHPVDGIEGRTAMPEGGIGLCARMEEGIERRRMSTARDHGGYLLRLVYFFLGLGLWLRKALFYALLLFPCYDVGLGGLFYGASWLRYMIATLFYLFSSDFDATPLLLLYYRYSRSNSPSHLYHLSPARLCDLTSTTYRPLW
ncbi:hypothetical protein Tco_0981601 [Tanacetum coccineum]